MKLLKELYQAAIACQDKVNNHSQYMLLLNYGINPDTGQLNGFIVALEIMFKELGE